MDQTVLFGNNDERILETIQLCTNKLLLCSQIKKKNSAFVEVSFYS